MSVGLVYETHSLTEDSESGRATGWLPGRLSAEGRRQARPRRDHDGERVLLVSHAAPRRALDHLLDGVRLQEFVHAALEWRPGWEYTP